ncbi:hypothetical protein CROQUDRAFT_135954 [Cronartium quercuum f. sp. fusiforme G11]|uniref:Zn(2)-C6 fungal-type domain-containing protein n=1 Tax=Cronartium quercuum f. sp. fusiforme G11 TaxID=708437 RepID=A0A9P6NDP7_9BASI|nr:hypothetical protein CROQUDRAFT_135954 [Cronartium quercuum f. sp. fusiforme G11]
MDLTTPNYPHPFSTSESSSAVTKREVKGARRVRNACLQCRERKIRCSRTYPCKGCVSRGDGPACDWQGGFPSGDIPVHQQRVAQQRREFEELNSRIAQMKGFMLNHLRQDSSLKTSLIEWTQIHPELDVVQDSLYSNLFLSNQHNLGCQPRPEVPDWAFSSLCPPDSATSFETCTSSATDSSTFRSYHHVGSSSSHSPPTAGSFLVQPEVTSPVPFLKPCKTSGYKSWKDLREAAPAGLAVYTSKSFDAPRLQQDQHAALQTLPSLDHFPSLPQLYSAPFLPQHQFPLATASLDFVEQPSMSGFQSSDHVYSTPSTSNPFNTTVPGQCFGVQPESFQADQNLYDGHMVHRISPRTPFEMALPSNRSALLPRKMTWNGDGQSTALSSMGSAIDFGVLPLNHDCRTGTENYPMSQY